MPVRQYPFVRAAKTPISFEFSNATRVAMLCVSLGSLCSTDPKKVSESVMKNATTRGKTLRAVHDRRKGGRKGED